MATPGVAVATALDGPCVSAPGLGSNVSNWLGPPAIQRRMQARRSRRSWSAWTARPSSRLRPAAPAPTRRRKPRRSSAPARPTRTFTQVCNILVMASLTSLTSPPGKELGAVDQAPVDVLERLGPVVNFFQVTHADGHFLRFRRPGQRPFVEGRQQLVVARPLGEGVGQKSFAGGGDVGVHQDAV